MRLRTLPLSVSGILAGAALVTSRDANFRISFVFALLTTVLLQILSNLANDYGDSQNGADNAFRVGPQRAVQSGAISSRAMKRGMIVTGVIAFLSGVALLWTSFGWRQEWVPFILFFLLGILAIIAAIRYTAGSNPYGYRGLGDVYVMLFFGIVGVGGSYYVLSGQVDLFVLLIALCIGALSTAVLNLNNLRDHEGDAKSGKITLVVKLGFRKAKIYHLLLFALAWTALILYLAFFNPHSWAWLTLVVLPLHAAHLAKIFRTTEPQKLDPELKKIALSTFLIGLILFITSVG